MAGSAAAPAPRRRNCRRGSFISDLPLWSLYSITSSARQIMGLCVPATRQAHRKYCSLPWLARHSPVATHHARELAREGKAEPGAAEALRRGGIGLAELLEQLGLLLRGHANAGVSDRELDPVATVGDPARPQP